MSPPLGTPASPAQLEYLQHGIRLLCHRRPGYADCFPSRRIVPDPLTTRSRAVLLMWHYLITFDKEFAFFWRQRFSGASALFFANRYLTLTIAIYGAPFWRLPLSDLVRPHTPLLCIVCRSMDDNEGVSYAYSPSDRM